MRELDCQLTRNNKKKINIISNWANSNRNHSHCPAAKQYSMKLLAFYSNWIVWSPQIPNNHWATKKKRSTDILEWRKQFAHIRTHTQNTAQHTCLQLWNNFHLSSIEKHTQKEPHRGDISIVYGPIHIVNLCIYSAEEVFFFSLGVFTDSTWIVVGVCAMCMEFVPNTLQKRIKNNNTNRTHFERHTMVSHSTATAAAAKTSTVTATPPTILVLT